MRDPIEDVLGYKAHAITAPKSVRLPVLDCSEPFSNVDELYAAAEHLVFPLFVKAVAGGGGRGMRCVANRGELREEAAGSERVGISTLVSILVGEVPRPSTGPCPASASAGRPWRPTDAGELSAATGRRLDGGGERRVGG
jgi:Carbamoyl-phosphate synthase L chain, ATP binding domain